ncbi:MAG: hypothetical protein NT075_06820 [Chloroflexi bacterium]|nr:hypothetical protein [Chloroflexota bacterium]
MTIRELLIEEINQAPEDVLQRLLSYLQVELNRRDSVQKLTRPTTSGPYADEWNQFIGIFSNEEWERPSQDLLEQRAEW